MMGFRLEFTACSHGLPGNHTKILVWGLRLGVGEILKLAMEYAGVRWSTLNPTHSLGKRSWANAVMLFESALVNLPHDALSKTTYAFRIHTPNS